eukprot:14653151-Alexandrium_andersonii.AAC.1
MDSRDGQERVPNGIIGFDGAELLPQVDALEPDELVRLWALSAFFAFAHRATGLAGARAARWT